MKRICALLLTAALLTGPAAAAGETAEAAQPALDLSAASAVLMEKETGTLLYEKASHEKLEPASVTKVMTLLLIFEALDSGRIAKEDVVTVSAYAAGMGGSQVYLKEGEQMTVGELVKCITVVSGNDAAVAMAEYLAGSETAFVDQMNQRARELGMGDTTFLNCTGFYQGATGLKTGSTDSALYCMSATAERDGMELIAVVMKSPTSADRFEDAKALLDYGFASYSLVSVYPDSPLAPIPVLLGEQGQVQPQLARECRLLVRKGQEGQISTKVTLAQDLAAPVEQGQTVGEMEVSLDGQVRDAVPILSAQGVERLTIPKIFSRLLEEMLMAG